jgi:hypothetical protein
MSDKLSVRIRENIGDYFSYSYPFGFSDLMDKVDKHEEFVVKSTSVDGYDLGILIRLKRFGGFHDMDWINAQLISEVGWLDDGETELFLRLAKLIRLGYIQMQTPYQDCVEFKYYDSIPKFRFVKYPC